MAARILLLLTLMAGLALGSGPLPRDFTAVAPCGCCEMPAGVTCCSQDDAPPSEAPLAPPTPAPLKQMLAPALPLLAILPSAETAPPRATRLAKVRCTAPARLALLCTRLI